MGDPVGTHTWASRGASEADEFVSIVQFLPAVYRCEKRANGRIHWTFGEGRLARELHLTTHELQGRSLDELFPPDFAGRLEDELGRVFAGETNDFYYQLSGRSLRQYAQPIWDSAGRVASVVGFICEVTKPVRAETQIRALYDQLAQHVTEVAAANRQIMEANRELEAFGFMVSHDLRSPLMVLDSVTQRLLTVHAEKLDVEAIEDLLRARQSVKRMTQLIEDLLKFARTGNGGLEMEDVDLATLVPPIVEELAKSDGSRSVQVDVQPGALARADPRMISIVLENLLRNAWKFTRHQAQAHIEFGWRAEGKERIFFLRDNGAGFDPTRAHRLFHAFERLHPRKDFEGTGIGLSTVERILRRHGGRVWAEGAVGRGATFYFTLPVPGGHVSKPEKEPVETASLHKA